MDAQEKQQKGKPYQKPFVRKVTLIPGENVLGTCNAQTGSVAFPQTCPDVFCNFT